MNPFKNSFKIQNFTTKSLSCFMFCLYFSIHKITSVPFNWVHWYFSHLRFILCIMGNKIIVLLLYNKYVFRKYCAILIDSMNIIKQQKCM